MKKPKSPQTIKEIEHRISELKEGIEEEDRQITKVKDELKGEEVKAENSIREHEMLIHEYKLLLKHYLEEKSKIANPSSRDGNGT